MGVQIIPKAPKWPFAQWLRLLPVLLVLLSLFGSRGLAERNLWWKAGDFQVLTYAFIVAHSPAPVTGRIV